MTSSARCPHCSFTGTLTPDALTGHDYCSRCGWCVAPVQAPASADSCAHDAVGSCAHEAAGAVGTGIERAWLHDAILPLDGDPDHG